MSDEQRKWAVLNRPRNPSRFVQPVLKQNQIDDLVAFVRELGDDAKAWRDAEIAKAKAANGGVLPAGYQLPHELKEEISPLDGTPRTSEVTVKDKELGVKLMDKLEAISPEGTNIVCEEEPFAGYNRTQFDDIKAHTRLDGTRGPTAWFIDPIDGTRNFTDPDKKHYGVLVGLVENGNPTFGIAYYPELDMMCYTKGTFAYVRHGDNPPKRLKIDKPFDITKGDPLTLTRSAKIAFNKPDGEGHQKLFDSLRAKGITTQPVAKAQADLPDEVPIMEQAAHLGAFNFGGYAWDYAARQAIFKAAGGEFIGKKTGRPPEYLSSPDFYLRPVWTGHVDTLKALDIVHPSVKLDRAPTGRGAA